MNDFISIIICHHAGTLVNKAVDTIYKLTKEVKFEIIVASSVKEWNDPRVRKNRSVRR